MEDVAADSKVAWSASWPPVAVENAKINCVTMFCMGRLYRFLRKSTNLPSKDLKNKRKNLRILLIIQVVAGRRCRPWIAFINQKKIVHMPQPNAEFFLIFQMASVLTGGDPAATRTLVSNFFKATTERTAYPKPRRAYVTHSSPRSLGYGRRNG